MSVGELEAAQQWMAGMQEELSTSNGGLMGPPPSQLRDMLRGLASGTFDEDKYMISKRVDHYARRAATRARMNVKADPRAISATTPPLPIHPASSPYVTPQHLPSSTPPIPFAQHHLSPPPPTPRPPPLFIDTLINQVPSIPLAPLYPTTHMERKKHDKISKSKQIRGKIRLKKGEREKGRNRQFVSENSNEEAEEDSDDNRGQSKLAGVAEVVLPGSKAQKPGRDLKQNLGISKQTSVDIPRGNVAVTLPGVSIAPGQSLPYKKHKLIKARHESTSQNSEEEPSVHEEPSADEEPRAEEDHIVDEEPISDEDGEDGDVEKENVQNADEILPADANVEEDMSPELQDTVDPTAGIGGESANQFDSSDIKQPSKGKSKYIYILDFKQEDDQRRRESARCRDNEDEYERRGDQRNAGDVKGDQRHASRGRERHRGSVKEQKEKGNERGLRNAQRYRGHGKLWENEDEHGNNQGDKRKAREDIDERPDVERYPYRLPGAFPEVRWEEVGGDSDDMGDAESRGRGGGAAGTRLREAEDSLYRHELRLRMLSRLEERVREMVQGEAVTQHDPAPPTGHQVNSHQDQGTQVEDGIGGKAKQVNTSSSSSTSSSPGYPPPQPSLLHPIQSPSPPPQPQIQQASTPAPSPPPQPTPRIPTPQPSQGDAMPPRDERIPTPTSSPPPPSAPAMMPPDHTPKSSPTKASMPSISAQFPAYTPQPSPSKLPVPSAHTPQLSPARVCPGVPIQTPVASPEMTRKCVTTPEHSPKTPSSPVSPRSQPQTPSPSPPPPPQPPLPLRTVEDKSTWTEGRRESKAKDLREWGTQADPLPIHSGTPDYRSPGTPDSHTHPATPSLICQSFSDVTVSSALEIADVTCQTVSEGEVMVGEGQVVMGGGERVMTGAERVMMMGGGEKVVMTGDSEGLIMTAGERKVIGGSTAVTGTLEAGEIPHDRSCLFCGHPTMAHRKVPGDDFQLRSEGEVVLEDSSQCDPTCDLTGDLGSVGESRPEATDDSQHTIPRSQDSISESTQQLSVVAGESYSSGEALTESSQLLRAVRHGMVTSNQGFRSSSEGFGISGGMGTSDETPRMPDHRRIMSSEELRISSKGFRVPSEGFRISGRMGTFDEAHQASEYRRVESNEGLRISCEEFGISGGMRVFDEELVTSSARPRISGKAIRADNRAAHMSAEDLRVSGRVQLVSNVSKSAAGDVNNSERIRLPSDTVEASTGAIRKTKEAVRTSGGAQMASRKSSKTIGVDNRATQMAPEDMRASGRAQLSGTVPSDIPTTRLSTPRQVSSEVMEELRRQNSLLLSRLGTVGSSKFITRRLHQLSRSSSSSSLE